ncbi:MAG TPA: cell wall hydrolase [Geminicoccus sp.]|uniref:cell wall hydrolase n=1 Tax=Geminicoccus sp. TaxID=2024832 RepID=UPI002E3015D4|nr:cell wall hydrolase [Geminicoccus sp.]HEX2525930.1 cell wall hydrolase [Geminicoccus sp.]
MRFHIALAAAAIGMTAIGFVAATGGQVQAPPAAAAAVPPGTVPPPPTLKSEYFLALTMYHEARGKSPDAMRAVGWVVLNRAHSEGFPDGIHDVVVQPTRGGKCQFGWACGDLNAAKSEPAAWNQAEAVAEELLFQGGRDPTKGAVWFWESWRPRPAWLARNARETLELGGHSFFAPAKPSRGA